MLHSLAFYPENTFNVMQMLENKLIFDTLDATFTYQSVNTVIQNHMHNLYLIHRVN